MVSLINCCKPPPVAGYSFSGRLISYCERKKNFSHDSYHRDCFQKSIMTIRRGVMVIFTLLASLLDSGIFIIKSTLSCLRFNRNALRNNLINLVASLALLVLAFKILFGKTPKVTFSAQRVNTSSERQSMQKELCLRKRYLEEEERAMLRRIRDRKEEQWQRFMKKNNFQEVLKIIFDRSFLIEEKHVIVIHNALVGGADPNFPLRKPLLRTYPLYEDYLVILFNNHFFKNFGPEGRERYMRIVKMLFYCGKKFDVNYLEYLSKDFNRLSKLFDTTMSEIENERKLFVAHSSDNALQVLPITVVHIVSGYWWPAIPPSCLVSPAPQAIVA